MQFVFVSEIDCFFFFSVRWELKAKKLLTFWTARIYETNKGKKVNILHSKRYEYGRIGME